MAVKKVEYQGKIKVKDQIATKTVLGLLKYLSQELGFTIKELESDEIKLVKTEDVLAHEGEFEMVKSSLEVEVEIEVSDDELEIEIESQNLEAVIKLTEEISARL